MILFLCTYTRFLFIFYKTMYTYFTEEIGPCEDIPFTCKHLHKVNMLSELLYNYVFHVIFETKPYHGCCIHMHGSSGGHMGPSRAPQLGRIFFFMVFGKPKTAVALSVGACVLSWRLCPPIWCPSGSGPNTHVF